VVPVQKPQLYPPVLNNRSEGSEEVYPATN
jgi:hypothetical protein